MRAGRRGGRATAAAREPPGSQPAWGGPGVTRIRRDARGGASGRLCARSAGESDTRGRATRPASGERAGRLDVQEKARDGGAWSGAGAVEGQRESRVRLARARKQRETQLQTRDATRRARTGETMRKARRQGGAPSSREGERENFKIAVARLARLLKSRPTRARALRRPDVIKNARWVTKLPSRWNQQQQQQQRWNRTRRQPLGVYGS